MWQRAMNLGGGGSSSIKSGTFEVTSTDVDLEIDTGLDNPKIFAILQISNSSNSAIANGTLWRDSDTTSATYFNKAANNCNYTAFTATQTANQFIMIKSRTNGKFNCHVTSGGSYAAYVKGTYVWYAE